MTQSDEEIAAHMGPDGPVAWARAWLELAKVGDVEGLWPLTDPILQLVMAQGFLHANREHPYLANESPTDLERWAEAIVDRSAIPELWMPFRDAQSRALIDWLEPVDLELLGAASHPRPIGPDTELVLFVPLAADAPLHVEEDTLIAGAYSLIVRRAEIGWRVRSTTDQFPMPGWPPTVEGDYEALK